MLGVLFNRPIARITAVVIGLLMGAGLIWAANNLAQTDPALADGDAPVPSRPSEPEPINVYLIEAHGYSPADFEEMVTHSGGTLLRTHPEVHLAVAQSDDRDFASRIGGYSGVTEVVQDIQLRWIPDPESFDPSNVVQSAANVESNSNPIDSAFFGSCEWYLERIDCREAFREGQFGEDAVVAVLDTGVDPFHQDLAGRIDLVNSVSVLTDPFCDGFVPDTSTFFDFNFHGTVVSNLVTSNGIGVAGVAPRSEVVAVKVLACDGVGSFGDVIGGILYAASLPDVDIVNMSLGALFSRSQPGVDSLTALLADAVDFATEQGKLVVASAGNDFFELGSRSDLIHLPSQASSNVVSVSATTIEDRLATYSNHGLPGALLAAPGGDFPNPLAALSGCPIAQFFQSATMGACSGFSILFPICATSPNFYTIGFTGTSAAAAIGSGVAALAEAADEYSNPSELREVLVESADDLGPRGRDPIFGFGRVNAGEAVD